MSSIGGKYERRNSMEWIIAHYAEIIAGLLLADRVAAATPETFRLFGIPIGKWDNQLVDGVRFLLSALLGKKK